MRGVIHDLLRACIALGTRNLGRLLALRHRWRIRRFGAHQAALHRRYGLGPDVPILRHGRELQAQLEAHAGQPLILKISPQFEERYGIAARIERNLWLERDWFEPVYGGRPWLLWTANGELQTEAAEGPLRWVVVRP